MKKNNILNLLEKVTIFFLVFNMINRELKLFNIDLRVIILLLTVFIMFYEFLALKKKVLFNSIQKYISIFYIFVLLSTILNRNHDYLVVMEQVKLLALYTYNYILIIFVSTRDVKFEFISKSVIISITVLILSLFLSYKLEGNLIFTNIEGLYTGPHMRNFYGLDFRLSGFAQDPNYASLSIVIAVVMTVFTNYRKEFKMFFIVLLAFSYGFTASKTILLGSILSLFLTYIIYKFTRSYAKKFSVKVLSRQLFFIILILVLVLFPILLVELNIDNLIFIESSSMTQRFSMWRNSLELFHQSPIIGSGLGSARSYYSLVSRLTQIHSTPFQLFSEFGAIGFILYSVISIKILNSRNIYSVFITILYLIFGLTYETMYLQFIPFIILLYFVKSKDSDNVDIVFVNSLSGGGAEVVASNLIANLSKINQVVVFTLDDRGLKYTNTEIVRLSRRNVLYNYFIINSTIDYLNEDLVVSSSSHLFISHIYTSLSSLRFKNLYYFHGTVDSSPQSILMKKLYKVVYFGKKLVFLNKDIKEEFSTVFKLNNRRRYIVKNFVDFSFIESRSELTFNRPNRRYFLFIGRLEDIKDPLFALNVYKNIKDNYDYDMYVLGSGSLFKELNQWVTDNNLDDRVKIIGFVDNPYVWIKNAEMVFVTSKFESDSLVIMESLHLGTKVVAINCNYGPKYIMVNELSEFLISERDVNAFSKKVDLAITNYPSNIGYIYEERSIEDYITQLRLLYNDW